MQIDLVDLPLASFPFVLTLSMGKFKWAWLQHSYHVQPSDSTHRELHVSCGITIPSQKIKGPWAGTPYIGPRLGDGPIFEASVSQLDAKERPGKLPTGSS